MFSAPTEYRPARPVKRVPAEDRNRYLSVLGQADASAEEQPHLLRRVLPGRGPAAPAGRRTGLPKPPKPPPNWKMPEFSRKKSRFSGKNRLKRDRLICCSSASTCEKSVFTVKSQVRPLVRPYLTSKPPSKSPVVSPCATVLALLERVRLHAEVLAGAHSAHLLRACPPARPAECRRCAAPAPSSCPRSAAAACVRN